MDAKRTIRSAIGVRPGSNVVLHSGTRRRVLSGLVTGVAGGALAACGGAAAPDAGSSASTSKAPVTIQFAHWGTPDYYERNRAQADEFEKKNPNIKIDVVHLQEQYQPKILAMFVADTPPDTHVLDMPVVQAYAKRDVLVSLNPFMKGDRTFKPEILHKKAVEIMSNKTGELLGMPSGAGPNLFFYNKQLFQAASLPTPYELYQRNQWTWAAFLDSARKLNQGGPGSWQVVGATTGLHRLWMNSNGIEEYDDYRAPKRALYGEAAAIEALQFLTDLRHKHNVTPVNVARDAGLTNDTDGFMQGRVAMMARWISGIGLYKNITDFTWGMVPYPKGPNAKGVVAHDYATSGVAIAKASKHPKEAWEWVKSASGDEGQVDNARIDQTSVYFSAASKQELIKQLRAIKTLETPTMTVDLMEKGNSFVRLLAVDGDEINKRVNENVNPMFAGTVAPSTAAKGAADAVNQFLAANPQ